jgi:hypothetical protein
MEKMIFQAKPLLMMFALGLCIQAKAQQVITFAVNQPATPLRVDAGPYQVYSPGSTIRLGGTPAATGGNWLYTFSWSPAEYLDNPSLPDPLVVNLNQPMEFTLTVSDQGGICVKKDVTFVGYSTSIAGVDLHLSVMPNPFSGQVKLNATLPMRRAVISNISGQVLLEEAIAFKQEHQLDTRALAAGIYFVNIVFSNGTSLTRRICKSITE